MENSDKAAICTATAGNAAVEMSLDERFAIMRSIGLESIDDDEDHVRMLLDKKHLPPICYVWCDPSPCVHISQGIMMVINVTKMVQAGCRVKILIADWFAHIQNKFGGDLNKIRTIGCYMIEIWKEAGLQLINGSVELIWLSDEINSHSDEYWTLVMDIARNNTLRRITRCYGIVEPRMVDDGQLFYPYVLEELMTSIFFYPCMHCAGILFQKADMWLLSMDHEEVREEDLDVSKLTREYCKDNMKGENRPIILSHNKLPNLIEYYQLAKLGDPAWAIFMEDEEYILREKISKAFCPEKVAQGNPCLEYIKYIVFPWFGYFEVLLGKEDKRTFQNMEELITDYESGALHSTEVKLALTQALNKILNKIMKTVRSGYLADKSKANDLEEATREYYRGALLR